MLNNANLQQMTIGSEALLGENVCGNYVEGSTQLSVGDVKQTVALSNIGLRAPFRNGYINLEFDFNRSMLSPSEFLVVGTSSETAQDNTVEVTAKENNGSEYSGRGGLVTIDSIGDLVVNLTVNVELSSGEKLEGRFSISLE